MYFQKSGKDNSEETIEIAVKTAKEKGIKYIVVASSTGYTASLLKHSGLNVVVVTYANGFKEPGIQLMDSNTIKEMKSYGFKVCMTTHVLSGAERALSNKFGGISPVEVMAHTLRMFGQGVKVAVEISTMALDSNLIPYGEDIIAIGGTVKGADTAVVIRPAHASRILETKIKKIICKPL